MKRILLIALCLLWPVFHLFALNPPRETYKIRTVVIDPGHGGQDAGCLGSSAREKNIALNLALKLGKLIEQNYPDIKVIYTRKTDVFIPLYERAEIANRNHADLFICVHLNSGNKAAYGAETYVMGLHKTEDNLNVAKRENASILLEDNYKTQYDGFDPNSPEANIIFSLYQNQFMHQSLAFASKIQDQFEEYGGRNNRGVKQAGFLVLYKTAMPAVLIESGFLTHSMEEKYLDSERGQSTISTAIFRAFKEYKLDMETSGPEINSNQAPVKIPVAELPPPDTASKVVKPEPKKDNVSITPAINSQAKQPDTSKSANSQPVPPKVNPISSNQGVKTSPVKENNPQPVSIPARNTEQNLVFYTVQVGASMNPAKDDGNFLKKGEISGIKCADGYTRYISGNFVKLEEARARQTKMRSNGFKDAFVTAFKGDKKITIQEAAEMLKTQ